MIDTDRALFTGLGCLIVRSHSVRLLLDMWILPLLYIFCHVSKSIPLESTVQERKYARTFKMNPLEIQQTFQPDDTSIRDSASVKRLLLVDSKPIQQRKKRYGG
ncbi:hypothetical protein [Phaffia rhodozyma]|uniref:Uncharacterized protein n=1 Tax=Phaffia rhodozyma TaxID=264483 RepID=A0A0F7SR09_PHARH|nr:hypothetical protein [Phaffia rhodozyma]